MSAYTRKQRSAINLPRIVELHQTGKITRERAVDLFYLVARRAAKETLEGTSHDFDNARRFVDLIVEHPVERWRSEFVFWALSVQLDAPWVICLDPLEVN